ncbi:MAG: nucleotidyltransferase domain-containing protein [Austwickia sp.]|nr:nucleotidyltransferase domain-containing protein [Austwickia sp.]
MSKLPNVEYGERGVALPNEILRSVVGSGVHGIAIEGTDDHDEMGVYLEPPEWILGVERHREDYIWRTQPEGVRSGHGDTDLVLYSLRKYLRLAIKGNPTVMLPLFAPEESLVVVTPLGDELRGLRAAFLSQLAVERFCGDMRSQHERMLGQSKRNVPNRPELIEKSGWDVKYGSHALRLAYQGLEIASTGSLSLPLPDRERSRVLAVKRGEVQRDEVSAEISRLEHAVRALLDEGRSPPARGRPGPHQCLGDRRATATLGLERMIRGTVRCDACRPPAVAHRQRPGARPRLRLRRSADPAVRRERGDVADHKAPTPLGRGLLRFLGEGAAPVPEGGPGAVGILGRDGVVEGDLQRACQDASERVVRLRRHP